MSAGEPSKKDGQVGEALSGDRTGQMRLEHPSEKYLDSFFEAMAEFEGEGIPQIPAGMAREHFPAYVQQLHDQSIGKNLKEGHIPSKEFWIIDAEGYAGRIILGLTFAPTSARLGHHVGYAVRPGRRRRGYATKALQCLLKEARKLNIHRLMPTCDVANVASRKVIERNGGVLLDSVTTDETPENELRFLIDLDSERASHLRGYALGAPSDHLEIERSALRTWPAIETQHCGDWLLRAAGAYTDRANTAQPLGDPGIDLESAIDQVEAFYKSRGLPPGFKVSEGICSAGIEDALNQREYSIGPTNLVLSYALAPTPQSCPAITEMSDQWLWLYFAGSGRDPALEPAMRQLAAGFLPTRNFVQIDEKACGLGIVDAHRLWLFDIATHPDHRRQGFGRQVVSNLLEWGAGAGATVAHLQVEERNSAAVNLYKLLGFEKSYTYRYRKKLL